MATRTKLQIWAVWASLLQDGHGVSGARLIFNQDNAMGWCVEDVVCFRDSTIKCIEMLKHRSLCLNWSSSSKMRMRDDEDDADVEESSPFWFVFLVV